MGIFEPLRTKVDLTVLFEGFGKGLVRIKEGLCTGMTAFSGDNCNIHAASKMICDQTVKTGPDSFISGLLRTTARMCIAQIALQAGILDRCGRYRSGQADHREKQPFHGVEPIGIL